MIDNKRISEFSKLYVTGNYSNKELAKRFSISAQTICKWIKKSRLIKYYNLKESIENELDILTLENNYSENSDNISRLLVDIERINNLLNDYGTRI